METIIDVDPVPPITDLLQAVTDILTRLGHPCPAKWQDSVNQDVHREDLPIDVKRFLINRCFRMMLGIVDTENTMDTRYCLVDTGPIPDWLKLFEEGVAPTVVRLNLP